MLSTVNVLEQETIDGLLPFKIRDTDIPSDQYRAIQNWVLCFLTYRGSRKITPDYGTDFLPVLRAGFMRLRSDVIREFNSANTIALSYCKDADNLYVTNAFLTRIDVDGSGEGRYLVIYIAFLLSDGTETRTYIELQ